MSEWFRRVLIWHHRLWIRAIRTQERELALTIAIICFVGAMGYLGDRVAGYYGMVAGLVVALVLLSPLIVVMILHGMKQNRKSSKRLD